MITKPPVAFIGYGFSPSIGFFQKMCSFCADKARAISEAKPLSIKLTVCSSHSYQLTCKRLGESHE